MTPIAFAPRSASSARIAVIAEPGLAQLVDPELLHRVQLEEAELGEADGLHRVGDDVLRPVLLGVEDRVGHAERHLVAELRRAEGVGVDQDVGHEP